MIYLLIGILFWLGCGFIGAGFWFAYLQRKYQVLRSDDFYSDREAAILGVFFGPFVTICSLLMYSAYGWLWPWGKKAKIEAGIIEE
jgi:hypothetical protein